MTLIFLLSKCLRISVKIDSCIAISYFFFMFLFQESLGEEVLRMSNDEIVSRTRLLDNEIKVIICNLLLNFISSIDSN